MSHQHPLGPHPSDPSMPIDSTDRAPQRMPLCEFSTRQEAAGEAVASCPPRLRIEFGDAVCRQVLEEGDLFTYEDDPAHLVKVFEGDRLVAVGSLVGDEGRLGVRIERVLGEASSAEAA